MSNQNAQVRILREKKEKKKKNGAIAFTPLLVFKINHILTERNYSFQTDGYF